MNLCGVGRVLGFLLLVTAVFLLLPVVVDLVYGEGDAPQFLIANDRHEQGVGSSIALAAVASSTAATAASSGAGPVPARRAGENEIAVAALSLSEKWFSASS